jgi:hypothetical protein
MILIVNNKKYELCLIYTPTFESEEYYQDFNHTKQNSEYQYSSILINGNWYSFRAITNSL